mgnify:CR=1 FL=1
MATPEELAAAANRAGLGVPLIRAWVEMGFLSDPPTDAEIEGLLEEHRIKAGEMGGSYGLGKPRTPPGPRRRQPSG